MIIRKVRTRVLTIATLAAVACGLSVSATAAHAGVTTDTTPISSLAVYRSSNATFYIRKSDGTLLSQIPFGQKGDLPAVGHYDDSGYDDLAVYRPFNATFYIRAANGSLLTTVPFGQTGDLPAIGHYQDGAYDNLAVYRPSNATFYIRAADGTLLTQVLYGNKNDVPATGHYESIAYDNLAVYRPSNATFYIRKADGTLLTSVPFGQTGDTPAIGHFENLPGSSGDTAAARYNWGTADAGESDEYNGSSVDLAKWGLFGASAGQSTGCSAGFNGDGQRCATQTTESGGYLTVTGTAGGKTGGLYSNHGGFKYGRVEVRERAYSTQNNGGAAYHAVPLLFPETADYTQAEIDFDERDVNSPTVDLFVHHNGTQDSCSINIDSTQFHNYAIDWEPSSVTWYVDANKVCTVNASIGYFDTTNGGAQMDMFPPTGTLMQPAREDVDWIHMYPVAATQFN